MKAGGEGDQVPEAARVDPISFEVIRSALLEATEEMALALRRSAYSTNIKTRADFSCAFFDSRLQAVAQSFAQPNHLGSLPELVPRAVREYGPENLHAGDALGARTGLPRPVLQIAGQARLPTSVQNCRSSSSVMRCPFARSLLISMSLSPASFPAA